MRPLLLTLVTLTLSGCFDASKLTADRVVYGGHDYIVFRVDGRHGQTFVHDPDCRCGRGKGPL